LTLRIVVFEYTTLWRWMRGFRCCGGIRFFDNTGDYSPIDRASYSRRSETSSPPWELHMWLSYETGLCTNGPGNLLTDCSAHQVNWL